MKLGVFLRIDSRKSIRANRPDSRCESWGHLSYEGPEVPQSPKPRKFQSNEEVEEVTQKWLRGSTPKELKRDKRQEFRYFLVTC